MAERQKPRLVGPHTQTMDERNRIPVPSKLMGELRRLSGAGEKGSVDVVVTMTENFRLGVYPHKLFWEIIEALEAAPTSDKKAKELLQDHYNFMDEQTLDKQNRFRVPSTHVDLCGLVRGEVTILGSGHFLEVLRRDTFLEQMRDRIPKMKENSEAVANSEWYKDPVKQQG